MYSDDFKKACNKLNELIKTSNNSKIKLSSGQSYLFKTKKKYSLDELALFETDLKINLPSSYKFFLNNVGACDLYINQYGLGIQIHEIEMLSDFSSKVFLNMKNMFPQLLLVVSETGTGNIGGFDLAKNKVNFSFFSSDENPDTWIDDTEIWVSFENWVINLVKNDGEIDILFY